MTLDEVLGPILHCGRPLTLQDSVDTVPTWDSARHVEVVLAVEEAIGRNLTLDEVSELRSIRAIVGLFKSHGLELQVSD